MIQVQTQVQTRITNLQAYSVLKVSVFVYTTAASIFNAGMAN